MKLIRQLTTNKQNVIRGIENIPLGTHLVSKKRMGILYAHHGIYAGDGKVIHHPGWEKHTRPFSKQPIEKTSIEDFKEGDNLKAVYYFPPKFESEHIIEEAERQMNNQENYALLSNNCEHFATLCIYGEAISYQVESKLGIENARKILQVGFQTTVVSASVAAYLGAVTLGAVVSSAIPGGRRIAIHGLSAAWKGFNRSGGARNLKNTVDRTNSSLSVRYIKKKWKPDVYIEL